MIHKKEFYFIRHGQTDYNASDAKVDHADVSLNTTGLKQAQDIEPIIASLPVKSVCYSPLKRAKETKEILSSRLEATHYEIPELGECTMQIWSDMTTCGRGAYESCHTHVKAFMNQVMQGINQALSCKGPVSALVPSYMYKPLDSFVSPTSAMTCLIFETLSSTLKRGFSPILGKWQLQVDYA